MDKYPRAVSTVESTGEGESLADTPGVQINDSTTRRPTFTKHAAGPISYFLSIPEYGPGEKGAVKIAHQFSESGWSDDVQILLPPRFGPDGADFDDYLQNGWLELIPPMPWIQYAAYQLSSCDGKADQALEAGLGSWAFELVVTETIRPDPLHAQVVNYASNFTIRTTQDYPVICDTAVDADNYEEYRDPDKNDPPELWGAPHPIEDGYITDSPHFVDAPEDVDAPFPDAFGSAARHPESAAAISAPETTTPRGMFGTVPSLRPKYHPAYGDAVADAGYGYGAGSLGTEEDPNTSGVSSLSGEQNEIYHVSFRDVYPSHLHAGYRGVNPLGHRGESENYFVVQQKNGALVNYDHKAKTGYSPQQWVLVEEGLRDVENPKRPETTGREQFVLWRRLKKDGIASEECSIPVDALNWYAINQGIVGKDDLVEVEIHRSDEDEGDGGPDLTLKGLADEDYNAAIEHLRERSGPDPARPKKNTGEEGGDRDPMLDFVIDGVEDLTIQQAMRVFAEEYIEEASGEGTQDEKDDWGDYKVEKSRLRTLWDVWSSFHGFEEEVHSSAFMRDSYFKGVLAVDPKGGKATRTETSGDKRPNTYNGIRLSEKGKRLDSVVNKTDPPQLFEHPDTN